ncbi:ABC transporter permease [Acinetobacter larvae]|uniref:ABC transporter permease n=1 Tax=Acinetobacter larvae TaxID=1789224 RepID=A0A1B2LVS9_9GAMM|nr:ABC transporter permease [Acinetobacter larvae]AOA57037.1 ABC transporter permease [Acinetobacter larvae]
MTTLHRKALENSAQPKPLLRQIKHYNALLSRLVTPLLLPLVIFILWWCAANLHWMPSQILPSPQQTFHSAWQLLQADLLWHVGLSLERLLLGMISGVLAGLVIGMALGRIHWLDKLVSPIFYALALIPTLAWLPILMMWLGIENSLKVFLIFKASLIPIVIHCHSAVRDIPPSLQEMAQVLQLSPYQRFRKLLLPAILPAFMTGLRLAVAASWTTLIAVELLASSDGIGYLMVNSRQLFQLDVVFVCIAAIALIGVLLDALFYRLEQKVVYWPPAALSIWHNKSARTVWSDYALKLIVPLLLLVLWRVGSHLYWFDAQLLPAPEQVLHCLWQELTEGSLLHALHHSLYRAVVGFLVGGVLGIAAGLWLGLNQQLEPFVAPSLNVLRLIAIFAWIPLITAWFGLGDQAKLVFVSLATFFPFYIATWRGVQGLSQQLFDVTAILQLNYWQRLIYLVLPSISPAVFAGLRIALLYAWMASFGVEYLMGSGIGVGTYMMSAQQHFEMDKVIAATVLVAILGAFLAWTGTKLEIYASSWRNHQS